MADIQQLERALVKADAAGDVDAARALAAEIRRVRAAPPETPAKEPGFADQAKRVLQSATPAGAIAALVTDPKSRENAANLAAGAARGAAGIGTTLRYPLDRIDDLIMGDGRSRNQERRAALDPGLQAMGAKPDSYAYGAGKLGAEIAGTAGVGGVLGQGAKALGAAPSVVNALTTSGMRAGSTPGVANMLTRVAGGAATGGATAGLVDPEQAGIGALIGGAMPPGLKIAGEAGNLLRKGASAAVKSILGASTGTGSESISAAYQAGKNKSSAFLDNMRGNASFDDVVDDARVALQKMRADRGDAYRSGMVDIANDKAVIDFKPISSAVAKVNQMGSYKGQQINKNAAGTVDEIMAKVKEWEALDPAEYHTPEGLDALKQAIGDIRDSTQFGTAARRAADSVYNAVKSQITEQAPTYSKVMKDYSEASATLKEVEKALSLGDKSSRDTAVRKLQSLLRNNAQTSYGNRLDLARTLEEKGGVDLMPSIAGQTMNSLMPRGMAGAIQKGGAVVGAATTGGASIPLTLAAAPFTSPRLVGEALYGLGRASGAAGSTINRLAQGSPLLSAQSPGLIEAGNALYRAAPLMAISVNQAAQR